MEPKNSYTYLIRNKLSNMIYIGASIGGKDKTYWGSSKVLDKEIEKYGVKNFEKTILCEYNTLNEAYAAEDVLVDEDFVAASFTYNQMPAKHQRGYTSETGRISAQIRMKKENENPHFREHMQESRSKAGKIGGKKNKGKAKSDNHKSQLSKARKGKSDWLTDEWRDNMSKASRKRWDALKSDPTYTHHSAGRCWINKNKETKMIAKSELQAYILLGWSKGRKVQHY